MRVKRLCKAPEKNITTMLDSMHQLAHTGLTANDTAATTDQEHDMLTNKNISTAVDSYIAASNAAREAGVPLTARRVAYFLGCTEARARNLAAYAHDVIVAGIADALAA
jgi:hypothetical protein